jgi:hypothetical protein
VFAGLWQNKRWKTARQAKQQTVSHLPGVGPYRLVANCGILGGNPSDLAPRGHSYFSFCLQPIIQIMSGLSTPLFE